MVKSLPNRSEVNIEETWNLQDLFKSEDDYQTALSELLTAVDTFHSKFKGQIKDSDSAIQVLKEYASIYEKFTPIGAYASLSFSTDQTNNEEQMRSGKFSSVAATVSSKLSFVDSELLELSMDVLKEAMNKSGDFSHYLKELIRQKPHQLHPEVEKTLAAYSSSFSAPYGLYNTTKMVDLSFEDFEVNGKKYPLSYVLFEGDWEAETDTEVRRAAFESFSRQLKNYQHTTAKTYDMKLQTEKTTSDLRGYDTIIQLIVNLVGSNNIENLSGSR